MWHLNLFIRTKVKLYTLSKTKKKKKMEKPVFLNSDCICSCFFSQFFSAYLFAAYTQKKKKILVMGNLPRLFCENFTLVFLNNSKWTSFPRFTLVILTDSIDCGQTAPEINSLIRINTVSDPLAGSQRDVFRFSNKYIMSSLSLSRQIQQITN